MLNTQHLDAPIFFCWLVLLQFFCLAPEELSYTAVACGQLDLCFLMTSINFKLIKLESGITISESLYSYLMKINSNIENRNSVRLART